MNITSEFVIQRHHSNLYLHDYSVMGRRLSLPNKNIVIVRYCKCLPRTYVFNAEGGGGLASLDLFAIFSLLWNHL